MLHLLLLSLVSFTVVDARQFTVKNSCGTTIWPGMFTGGTSAPSQATGWELTTGNSTTFAVPDDWTAGRIWARTGCTVQDGSFQCLTGACGNGGGGAGENGDITCAHPDQPPATLAEFTLIPSGEDNFDISLVDGFNIPMNVVPSISSCSSATCDGNVNAVCPPLLRTSLDEDGVNLACLSPCNAGFGGEEFGNRACCTGGYDNATACAICGVDYYDVFKDACKNSYAYPYDEKSGTALWTCGGSPNYEIEFCPSGSDYVGASPNNISNKYVDATATCTSMITAFATTFSVGPSPTATATIGTLSVVATAATGIDGAAAIGTGASQVASSFSTSAVASVASTTALSAGQDTSSSASVAAVSPVSSTLSVSSAASSSQASNSATSTAPLISTGADTVALAAAQPTSNVTSASSLVSSAPASSCRKQGQYLDIVSPGHSKRVNSISCSSLAFVTNVLSIEREQACPKRDQEALASGGGAETMDDP